MDIIILAFATYRLSFLFAEEDGVLDVIGKFRKWIGVKSDEYGVFYGTNELSKMIVCTYCSSIWFGVAMVIGYVLVPHFVLFMLPFALSGAVVAVQES